MNQCQWCSKALVRGYRGYRSGALFCSDECRTHYHNAKKKVLRDKRSMFFLIENLHDMAKKDGELGAAANHALELIKGSVSGK